MMLYRAPLEKIPLDEALKQLAERHGLVAPDIRTSETQAIYEMKLMSEIQRIAMHASYGPHYEKIKSEPDIRVQVRWLCDITGNADLTARIPVNDEWVVEDMRNVASRL
jgi:hypothetical protein